MPWVFRGLRNGILTTRYPRRPDPYADAFPARVTLLPHDGPLDPVDAATLPGVCPTGAISSDDEDRLALNQGACILCGACVRARPDLFAYQPGTETGGLTRTALTVPAVPETDRAIDAVRDELARRVKALRRSVHIRHVDAGSDGAEEWEIQALLGPVYDIHRLGIFITASPRHADILLVTGAGSHGMAAPLRRTYQGMPAPRIVIAAGTDAVSGGLIHPSYAVDAGIGEIVPVDVWVPGSPPSPFSLLHAILLALGRLPQPRNSTGFRGGTQ
jgi:Ni,Fe-hydrogenase III small subunit/ferredoxin